MNQFKTETGFKSPKRMLNYVMRNQNVIENNQMDGRLSAAMSEKNVKAMTKKEIHQAQLANLEVKGGYCI